MSTARRKSALVTVLSGADEFGDRFAGGAASPRKNLMAIDAFLPIAKIVLQYPASARVLERYDIDYCCGGGRTLAATCETEGFSVDDVVAAIEDVLEAEEPKASDWDAMSMAAFCEKINATHHAYTREAFVHLTPLVAKVLNVHGDRHRELSDVQRLFEALAADLLPHLAKEERILFPSIVAIEADPNHPMARCFAGPLAVMRSEHETVGKLLHDIRSVTRGYQPPPGACTSFRVLYAGLASLAADLHTHIHLENNVLFPRVEALLANAPMPASHADV